MSGVKKVGVFLLIRYLIYIFLDSVFSHFATVGPFVKILESYSNIVIIAKTVLQCVASPEITTVSEALCTNL